MHTEMQSSLLNDSMQKVSCTCQHNSLTYKILLEATDLTLLLCTRVLIFCDCRAVTFTLLVINFTVSYIYALILMNVNLRLLPC